MSWALEEYVEDAIRAYLESELRDSLQVYVAWTNEEITYPCAVVYAGSSENVGETEFNGVRALPVEIAVMTEAVAANDLTPRQRNRVARDTVMEALAQTSLQDDLNALTPAGVIFSYALIGAVKRDVESDKRVFVSHITIDVVASPKETA